MYDDLYSTDAGALAQARHVFMGGNGLPARWQGRHRFVILETGFGLGHNFLATWQAWREDPSRCERLVFISVEKHPVRRTDLAQVHEVGGRNALPDEAADRPAQDLRARMVEAWPVLTPGWHDIDMGEPGGGVRLMLGLGDVANLLPGLLAEVDAFYLDGFSPAKNPDMWADSLLSRLGRLAAPGATAATWTYARVVRDGLHKAGFVTERGPGLGSKRDMLSARFEPRHVPAPPAGGLWPELPPAQRQALVLGAGLAGSSATLALRQAGWGVHLIDEADGPAQGASGNPGGLFHSIVHGEDGVHARAHRAAALATHRALQPLWASGQVNGQGKGLLRLDAKTTAEDARDLLTRLGLPNDHVAWLDSAQAAQHAGLPVPSGGWWFHQAGWVHPAGWVQAMLSAASACPSPGASVETSLRCSWGTTVARIRRIALADGPVWQALGADGQVLGQGQVLVLANAGAARALLAELPADQAVALPPMSLVRGQITRVPAGQACSARSLPHQPVAGSGYVLPLQDGSLLCGATTQHHDMAPETRQADHAH
ncbi:tRNA (5-methylaminomethyl-2-thiouridine)(34)-methyltransferase MnmD, partial [Aquabacterium sp.]|uniref:tRNA (5-methylaminomethyl-2-thiouridine)(34)-methyltransferase MnmD n=1 Tax=Aquabacterium sp. TaxID=1872578 RepID=UPI0025C2A475